MEKSLSLTGAQIFRRDYGANDVGVDVEVTSICERRRRAPAEIPIERNVPRVCCRGKRPLALEHFDFHAWMIVV